MSYYVNTDRFCYIVNIIFESFVIRGGYSPLKSSIFQHPDIEIFLCLGVFIWSNYN